MEAKGLKKVDYTTISSNAYSVRRPKPVTAVILHKPNLTPDENPWQAVIHRARRFKDVSAKTSHQASAGDSISTLGAKSYAAATATTQASSTIPVPPPKWEEKLLSVCDKLRAVESAVTSQTTQLSDIHHQQQHQTNRLQEFQSQISLTNQALSTIDTKVTDNVVIVGTFKNSIQHLEVSSQAHAGQITAIHNTLEASQARLAQAELQTQELHNSLQEQLQVQARNLSMFTTAISHRLGDQPTASAAVTPAQPSVHTHSHPTLQAVPKQSVDFDEDYFVDVNALPPTPRRTINSSRDHNPPPHDHHNSSPSTREPPTKRTCPNTIPTTNSPQMDTTLFPQATANLSGQFVPLPMPAAAVILPPTQPDLEPNLPPPSQPLPSPSVLADRCNPVAPPQHALATHTGQPSSHSDPPSGPTSTHPPNGTAPPAHISSPASSNSQQRFHFTNNPIGIATTLAKPRLENS